MKCRDIGEKARAGKDSKYLVLAGNPNVGKSVLFNALSGLYMDVSNFPGTTLAMCYGHIKDDIIIDTPGVYGLSSFTGEEKLTRELVLSSDAVINVVDAAHLERDLFLTLHIIDAGLPMVVALNMMDEALKLGVEIDVPLLEQILGVPVVPMVAVEKKGLDSLVGALGLARQGKVDIDLDRVINDFAAGQSIPRGEALLLLEGDGDIASRLGLKPGDKRSNFYRKRRERANDISASVINPSKEKRTLTAVLGRMMLRPSTGLPILAAVLAATYLLVGVFFAQIVVGFTEGTIMRGYFEPMVRNVVFSYFSKDSSMGIILAGQFGLVTMTITYVLGLLAPLVLGFFLVLSILEDSGYLPRIAILVDRVLSSMGLNGLAIIPLILGFGCVTMASITTRLLPTDRERRIAIFLLNLAVPCSAQLAFVTAVLAGLGPSYLVFFITIITGIMVGAGTILGRIMPGTAAPLLVDLPPLRLPRLNNVFYKAWLRSWDFLKEAFPLFVGGALFLSLLKVTGLLEKIQQLMEPVTVGWLYLPREAANPFIMGLIRRDFGTAGILGLNLDPQQQFVALVTLTLFVPCIASVMVMFKERGWKEGIIMWLVILMLAFLTGGVIARLLHLFDGLPGVNAPLLLTGAALSLIAFFMYIGQGDNKKTIKSL